MTSRIALALAVAAISTSAAAQSNRKQPTWDELLKPLDVKTNPAIPITPPQPTAVPLAPPAPPAAVATIESRTSWPPDPVDLAHSIATLMQYDLRCGAAPKRFMTAAGLVAHAIPQQIMNTALNDVSARYVALGQETWCAIWKHTYRNDFDR